MYVHLLLCYLNKVQNARCNDTVYLTLNVAYSYNVAILRTACLVSLHPLAPY